MSTEYLKPQIISPKPNYHEFLARHRTQDNRIECPICYGSTMVRDPKECDPIEGYKMANWYECGWCEGDGYLSEKKSRESFNIELFIWKHTQDHVLKNNARIEEINKKLARGGITMDDFNFIREALG